MQRFNNFLVCKKQNGHDRCNERLLS
jgi:hypothetical protein